MKKIYLVFTFFYFCSVVFAQSSFFRQKPLLFFDKKSNQIIIIDDDSIIYKKNSNVKILLKHTVYPEKLNQYLPFNIDNKTFFVHEGCGVVLEYRNDSIVRVDKSFLHNNQFNAAKFIYNKEIYYFGGYGLFTSKNILIKEIIFNKISLGGFPIITIEFIIDLNSIIYIRIEDKKSGYEMNYIIKDYSCNKLINFAHLNDKLNSEENELEDDEKKLKEKIIKFREDELHHKDIAYKEGATKKGMYSILDKLIKTGSKIAINISEKI